MPLKLNVGLNRKVGESNYGSRGASVHFEVEVDSAPVRDPDELRSKIRYLFDLAKDAVDEELRGGYEPRGNGRSETNFTQSNGQDRQAISHSSNSNGHRATAKQFDYARQLAGQIDGLSARSLDPISVRMFGKPLADISSLEASGLIDCLKAIKSGDISVEDALNGAAA